MRRLRGCFLAYRSLLLCFCYRSDFIAGGETSEVLETSEVWRVGLAWGLCFFVRLDGAGGNGVIAIAGDELETARFIIRKYF